MANKMLIDATHPEETRVVVVRGNRVEEFDFETAAKKQLRGNIYLAKVTRVEPSLQAAFVDYGGNRHGFLAFSEIHPDYYQIPVADRLALLAEEAKYDQDRAKAEDRAADRPQRPRRRRANAAPEKVVAAASGESDIVVEDAPKHVEMVAEVEKETAAEGTPISEAAPEAAAPEGEAPPPAQNEVEEVVEDEDEEEEAVEAVGGADAMEEVPERPVRVAPRRYKIQEVIKRRQVLLVQVVKEERGNKGAALTTYLSLAGRYSVLMPNTARGGGISRKITNPTDRKRLKAIAQDLEVPEGMGVILRTAGAARTKAEVKRDFEYLMRLWENVAELTLKSQAPMLVYEEGSLIKRAIRDLYNKDIDEVIVSGDAGYREAKDFMRMLMPSHAKNVQPYREAVPLFTRTGIESQLDQMFQPQVQLRSGGYVVLNQTEALVSIDVNSGRSTREHNIEDTALKTNLEAAEEVARQLRLRDLAGLIVIDFIDMEEKRNNRAVERKLKECLKQDRARIQVGRISHFGLLEMSRQRIRTSVLESTMEVCSHCNGTGFVRSPSSAALQILRMIEEALIRDSTHNITVRTRTRVALYVLNQKRINLRALEERFGVAVTVEADEHLPAGTTYVIDKGELSTLTPVRSQSIQVDTIAAPELEEEDEEVVEARPQRAERQERPERRDRPQERAEVGEDGDGRRKRRRRRRRRGGRDGLGTEGAPQVGAPAFAESPDEEGFEGDEAEGPETEEMLEVADAERDETADGDDGPRRRRRGRRGGRRNRRDEEGFPSEGEARPEREPRLEPVTWLQPGEAAPEAAPAIAMGEVPPRRIEIETPDVAEAPIEAPARLAPGEIEVVTAAAPAPEPETEPVMPRIPDLAELVEEPKVEADPAKPRRFGWWSRRG